ncbi:uncharacterized protein L969DRAFT_95636 [Mixia osmundae IAM 14324]|uniref:Zn(2)-C6 fungal-type domain-containing protein n=1 Tax=Mixia osmundae (strain CBS 9802 / IAM 14324 / JCM 22182 / KY 12970) TaxID=764103 RepID=G7E801_MIXOS|nr:uncharacterized protein L969DRAFT_95636 [Mixia osmundae IAM 14324]KEI38560.1 hypothetical protein L969DRAFT_95636 [Mixia osmundae IAM 14324]GAA98961.1 hypothetical protein E5Q_05649 [Mixia osmundae IAM 14324]
MVSLDESVEMRKTAEGGPARPMAADRQEHGEAARSARSPLPQSSDDRIVDLDPALVSSGHETSSLERSAHPARTTASEASPALMHYALSGSVPIASSNGKRRHSQVDAETTYADYNDNALNVSESASASTSSSHKRSLSAKPPLPRGSACLTCRKRKLRCDGARPKCATCARLQHPCGYDDANVAEGLDAYTRSLEEKVNRLTEELNRAHNAGSAPPSPFASVNGGMVLDPVPTVHHPNSLKISDSHYSRAITRSNQSETAYPTIAAYPRDDERMRISTSKASSPSRHQQESYTRGSGLPSGYTQSDTTPSANSLHSPEAMRTFDTPKNEDMPPSPMTNPLWKPGLTWLYSLPAAKQRLGNFPLHTSERFPASGGESSASSFGTDLPDETTFSELIYIYFETVHKILPFLHETRFKVALRAWDQAERPSAALIYAIMAVASPYHDSEHVRDMSSFYHRRFRQYLERFAGAGLAERDLVNSSSPRHRQRLDVEVIQASCIASIIEFGNKQHQSAYITTGIATRLASMIGLHKMDEEEISSRSIDRHGGDQPVKERRQSLLRSPAVGELPTDAVMREECRRTMWTLLILDRWTSACAAWPAALDENLLRLLLPCPEQLYVDLSCNVEHNVEIWPHEDQPDCELSDFAVLSRVCLMGSRIAAHKYRSPGPRPGGPLTSELVSEHSISLFDGALLEEEQRILAIPKPKYAIDRALALITIHGVALTLHAPSLVHTQERHGIEPVASREYSLRRCLYSLSGIWQIVTDLLEAENLPIPAALRLPPYLSMIFTIAILFLQDRWSDVSICTIGASVSSPLPEDNLLDIHIPWAAMNMPAFATQDGRERVIEDLSQIMLTMGHRWPIAESVRSQCCK